jgi:hypothetical protein
MFYFVYIGVFHDTRREEFGKRMRGQRTDDRRQVAADSGKLFQPGTRHHCFALIELHVILASPSLGHYASLSFVVIGRSLQIARDSGDLNGFDDFNGFNAFNELTNSLIN